MCVCVCAQLFVPLHVCVRDSREALRPQEACAHFHQQHVMAHTHMQTPVC